MEPSPARSAGYQNVTVETCRFRQPATSVGDENSAGCRLLRELTPMLPASAALVTRSVCDACCRSFSPTASRLNPVVASVLYQRLRESGPVGETARGRALVRRAEQFLDVEAVRHQAAPRVAIESPRSDSPARQVLGQPARRSEGRVRQWAVAVTTAPRREPTLSRCLESLSRAGWPRPLLAADGQVQVDPRFASLPFTVRDEPLGVWPHYYLTLAELLMRTPLADAYLLVQDDALFFDAENLREYLEEILWPTPEPAIVSLYWAGTGGRPKFGWNVCAAGWESGAVALLYPRQIAIDLLLDPAMFGHRWDPDGVEGHCDVIETWAKRHAIAMCYPTPSLVQHIGTTSAVWPGSFELTPGRRAECFLGDVVSGG